MDLVGLDVAHAVMKSMYQQYFEEPKYRPSFLAEPRVAAGLLGRKTRPRLVRVRAGRPADAARAAGADSEAGRRVWAVPELKELLGEARREARAKPSAGRGLLRRAARQGRDHGRARASASIRRARSAVDPLFGFAKRRTLMVNSVDRKRSARRGARPARLRRRAGLGDQRFARLRRAARGRPHRQRRLRHRADAHRHARGPRPRGDARPRLSARARSPWATRSAPKRILAVLEAMHELYQEPRYRPSPWLRRRAQLGVSLLTPE